MMKLPIFFSLKTCWTCKSLTQKPLNPVLAWVKMVH